MERLLQEKLSYPFDFIKSEFFSLAYFLLFDLIACACINENIHCIAMVNKVKLENSFSLSFVSHAKKRNLTCEIYIISGIDDVAMKKLKFLLNYYKNSLIEQFY